MPIAKQYYIDTGQHGVLHGTTPEDIDDLFEHVSTESRIVLYFHGGLVPRDAGLAIAAKLLDGTPKLFLLLTRPAWTW